MNKKYIPGVIVVEGSHDASKVSLLYETTFVITNGYEIPEPERKFLKALKNDVQVIVLTDKDEAGKKIREELNSLRPNVINIEGQNNQEQDENSNNAPAPNSENSDCPVPADISKYQKDFSFDNLMSKIKETAKKAGLKAIYMALLLYYALESPTISTMDKAIIYGALGYFICPIDIIPDILPFIGLTDDIAVLAWAFSRVKHNVTDMTREKAKTKLKIWFGNFDEAEIDDL